MKKTITMLLILALCLGLCACGGNQEEVQNLQNLLAEREQFIQELENELMNLSRMHEEQNEVIHQQNQQIVEQQEKLGQHHWVIYYDENSDYDGLINWAQQRKEEARKAEMEARGIVEITITIDNWDQYFEYVPTGYPYIRNSFDELTHMNMLGGLRLKDGYNMVEDGGTQVNFEMETYMETRTCTVDFTAETFEYGEAVKQGTRLDTTTTRFSDRCYGEVLGFGSIDQVNSDNGNQITTELTIEAISRMLRAEGVLYLYQD